MGGTDLYLPTEILGADRRRGRRTRARDGREEFEKDEKVVLQGEEDGEAKGQRGSISVKEI